MSAYKNSKAPNIPEPNAAAAPNTVITIEWFSVLVLSDPYNPIPIMANMPIYTQFNKKVYTSVYDFFVKSAFTN